MKYSLHPVLGVSLAPAARGRRRVQKAVLPYRVGSVAVQSLNHLGDKQRIVPIVQRKGVPNNTQGDAPVTGM